MARRFLVLGGGIAGLTAAYRLSLAPDAEVTLLEATSLAGGAIRTTREQGFLLEWGPDCFLAIKPAGIALCRELGLESRLIGTIAENRRSFVARGGKLHAVPEGFYLMAPSSMASLATSGIFSLMGKMRMAMEPFIRRRADERDESLASFVRRRLGRECLERLAQPMIAGITTADPEKLSMRAAMPQFPDMEKEHGSIIRALARRKPAGGTSGPRYGMFASLDTGLQGLVDALLAKLGDRVKCGVRAGSLRHDDGKWTVSTSAGPFEAEALAIALPAPAAGPLVSAIDPALGTLLNEVCFASVATIHVAWKETDFTLPHAMGFVVPAVENRVAVACSFTSRKFPGRAPEGVSLVRVFAGGATRPDHASLPDAELTQRVIADLRALMGAKGDPVFVSIHRHSGAMPQYYVGHLDRVADMERRAAGLPRLSLCGASYRGVGVPDCVKSGEDAAAALLRG